MPLPGSSRTARLALLLAAPLLLLATALAHRSASARRDAFPADEDLVYLPRAGILKAASLGHPEAMADLVFLRTITYFGAQLTSTTKNFDWLDRHLDTVIALDPYFRASYRFGGQATMYNGRPITNHEVHSSIHFLEEGLKVFPSDWELAFMLGCNYMFELRTTDPRQKESWRRIGGEYIRRAAIAGGGPPWLATLAATIMSKEGETEAALRYLEEAYLTAPDDRTRDEVGRMLLAKRRSSVASLTAARDSFVAAWQKTLPYAPPDLYVIVGEPPPVRRDWRFLVERDALSRALAEPTEPTPTPAPAPTTMPGSPAAAP